jgi:CBS domain containing-hemolysin-like protein
MLSAADVPLLVLFVVAGHRFIVRDVQGRRITQVEVERAVSDQEG